MSSLPDGVAEISARVGKEIGRALALHGVQNHPSYHPASIPKPAERAAFYSIPSAESARNRCEANGAYFDNYGDILLEEVCEAFAEPEDSDELVEELVQVAGVAIQWAAAILRRRRAAVELEEAA